MKLSEAMRIGAAKHPKATGELCVEVGHVAQHRYATCALGAAYVGVKGRITEELKRGDGWTLLHGEFPEMWKEVDMPEGTYSDRRGNRVRDTLEVAIFRLNDKFEWSRERIADWLESIGY